MTYKEDRPQSAEILRFALAHMSQHPAATNPNTYAVWYEYASGGNQDLRHSIDELISKKQTISDDHIAALYDRHVSDCNEARMGELQVRFRELVARLGETTNLTSGEAAKFGKSLASYTSALDGAQTSDAVREMIKGLLNDTHAFKGSVTELQQHVSESQQQIEKLQKELAKSREESMTDPLTGLYNRKVFSNVLESVVLGATPGRSGPCLIMIDIDHFKKINDTYGHMFGDKVIKALAVILKDSVKGQDTAARYGGEEFAIVLPDTSIDGAHALAEAIRRMVARARIKRLDSEEIVTNFTVSMGVSEYLADESGHDLLSRADAALYESKHAGRNRITLAGAAVSATQDPVPGATPKSATR